MPRAKADLHRHVPYMAPYPSASAPPTPKRGDSKGRASSLPLTSLDPNNTQCSGITKNESVEVPCFQHIKEAPAPSRFRSRKGGKEWVKFKDYIPDYLSEKAKVALRVEMEKPPSEKEEEGYIYCFEILNNTTPKHVHLKVGRTKDVPKRVKEWSKQCGTHRPILLGHSAKGPNSHRLERLIHIELSGLTRDTPYLPPGFPKKVVPPMASGSGSGNGDTQPTPTWKPKVKDLDARMSGKICPDCGRVHREIFTFAKAKADYVGREWVLIVQPLIDKWGKFVEQHV